jgi:hypothetical protein
VGDWRLIPSGAGPIADAPGRFGDCRRVDPVDAKSLLMLLTVGVSRDHRIRLSADGVDEDAAIEALVGLIASGRGETPAA